MPDPPPEDLIVMQDAVVSDAEGHARVRVADWRLRRGEFWVVGGFNWSGKTEWLMTAAGLQPLTAGRHVLCGTDTEEMTPGKRRELRRRIGFVFEQNGRPFMDLTVAENLALPLRYDAEGPVDEETGVARLRAVLELCGLLEVADRQPGELSRGMQRRMGLARALMLEPEVLFLDTPLVGLDPAQCRWWLDLLGRFHAGEALPIRPPRTMVATVSGFRPWLGSGRRFAMMNEGLFETLGDSGEVLASARREVRELSGNESE